MVISEYFGTVHNYTDGDLISPAMFTLSSPYSIAGTGKAGLGKPRGTYFYKISIVDTDGQEYCLSDPMVTWRNGDGDDDYCNAGQWTDCNDNSHCAGSRICSLAIHDCVNPDGYVTIRNLGTTGIEDTNQEYTSTRSVMLELNYSVNAVNCRYTNYPNNSELPPASYYGWTLGEACVGNRVWLLSEGVGTKTVYYQINFSDRNSTFNDTIYFNYTGGGLDATPPTAPVVYHNNYTNSNQSITVYWYNASDPDSITLGIPLKYQVTLYTSGGTSLGNVVTTSNSYTFTGFNLQHNTIVYANVSVINSGNQWVNVTSAPLVIDLEKPIINSLLGSYRNLSALAYQSLNNVASEDTWLYATQVNFSWNGSDALSNSVVAYSYLLTKSSSASPDEVPEGAINNFANSNAKAYTSLAPSKYYFYIKAQDLAGNWGDIYSLNFSLDSTGPSRPRILTETGTGETLTYTWSESTDDESEVVLYRVNLTDENENLVNSFNQTNTNNRSHTFAGLTSGDYNATVGAKNGAGIWRWSNQESVITDFDAPIISPMPNKTVVSNRPILKVWTDEKATCYYNRSDANVYFAYTNTTYHETKLNVHSNDPYTYTITCDDPYSNSASEEVSFTVDTTKTPTDVFGDAAISTYEQIITTFTINVESDGTNISGILRESFSLTIGDESKEFSVFDIGDGRYNISFIAPDKGSYNLKVTIDSSPDIDITIPLLVNELYLSAVYEDSLISSSPDTTKHITYFTNRSRIGMATTDNINLDDYVTTSNKLNITGIDHRDTLLIFNTKASNSLLEREKRLNQESFLNSVNPSFGFQMTDNYIIEYVLRYDSYVIQSDVGETLGTGRHRLLVSRTYSNDLDVIKFSNPSGSSDRSVVSG